MALCFFLRHLRSGLDLIKESQVMTYHYHLLTALSLSAETVCQDVAHGASRELGFSCRPVCLAILYRGSSYRGTATSHTVLSAVHSSVMCEESVCTSLQCIFCLHTGKCTLPVIIVLLLLVLQLYICSCFAQRN